MNNIQADHDLKLECHPSAEICPVALQIRAHFSHLKAAEGYISDPKFSFLRGQTLELRHHPGQFLKRCPGTKGDYLCCGYNILNAALNCPLGCSYCILQAYLNTSDLVVFTNWDDCLRELDIACRLHPQRVYRVGTGELTDSLCLDPFTEFTKTLVPFMRTLPHCILELKTKTDFIDNLNNLDHGRKTIVAWSLATDALIKRHECFTTSVEQRIRAAQKVIEWGYPVAFHFDPVIRYPHWEQDYAQVINALFDAISLRHIVWISLGAFRFTSHLAEKLQNDQQKRQLLLDEYIFCPDGKFRYFWTIRAQLLGTIARMIRVRAPKVFLYLCMESRTIWSETLGWVPKNRQELATIMDQQTGLLTKTS